MEYRLLHYASRALYGALLDAGVEIYEYHKSFLHAKVAVIDRKLGIFSYGGGAVVPTFDIADVATSGAAFGATLGYRVGPQWVVMGEIDGYPFGFAVALIEGILPQAAGEKIGSIRLIYVEPEAREISLGEEMRDYLIEELRRRGISRFDAHVLPGHRLAKNFFEAGGFSARAIIMHHDDHKE